MVYRWLRSDEITEHVNPALVASGWAELNLDTCRVMGAFTDGSHLVEFLVLQLFPILGPLLRIDNEQRDGGETSRMLADKMYSYLIDSDARGFMAVAESPVTKRLCERFGMEQIAFPVFHHVAKEVAKT